MIDPVAFERAEVLSALRQLKTFAQAGPPAAEHASARLLAFSSAATRFVDAFEADPNASPAELLLAAGEAQAELEALQREFDCAMDQIERLPFKLDLHGSVEAGMPQEPEPIPGQ